METKMSSLSVQLKLLYLAFMITHVGCALNATRIAEILKDYDSKQSMLSPRENGKPLHVGLAFAIQDMVPLSFINNHIYVVMDVITGWRDKKLQFDAESPDDKIILQSDGLQKLWKPDIRVDGEKGVKQETFPETLAGSWILPTGDVFFSQRLSITVYCPMSLVSFPFDTQSCSLRFESYSYNISQMRLGFISGNISIPTNIVFSRSFKIAKFLLHSHDVQVLNVDYGLSGIFDQIRINFVLKRDIRFYIMEYYFPIICAVFLSFMSFWVNHKSTPARVALPVTTFLTLTAMLDHVRASSNVFGAAEALEVFLNVSIYFVFGVMVEYGIVETMQTQLIKRTEAELNETGNEGKIDGEDPLVKRPLLAKLKTHLMVKCMTGSDDSIYLDRGCRYLFPLGYTGFLVVYFVASIVNLRRD